MEHEFTTLDGEPTKTRTATLFLARSVPGLS